MERLAPGLLDAAQAAGLAVRIEGEQLIVRGPRTQAALATRLLAHKAAVMAALGARDEQAIAARVAVLRPLVPERGPIPFLIVRRQDTEDGQCHSCREPLAGEERYRCRLCIEAVRRVLAEVETKRQRTGAAT